MPAEDPLTTSTRRRKVPVPTPAEPLAASTGPQTRYTPAEPKAGGIRRVLWRGGRWPCKVGRSQLEMKVICDRGALLDAINLVSGAVAARTPRVQLTCVKLTASKSGGAGDLTLSATDAEVALKLTLTQVDVQEPGEALIPADKLRQIVSAEDNEPTLTIEVENDVCHIRGADAHFKVFGYPPADFPPIPDFSSLATGNADHGK